MSTDKFMDSPVDIEEIRGNRKKTEVFEVT